MRLLHYFAFALHYVPCSKSSSSSIQTSLVSMKSMKHEAYLLHSCSNTLRNRNCFFGQFGQAKSKSSSIPSNFVMFNRFCIWQFFKGIPFDCFMTKTASVTNRAPSISIKNDITKLSFLKQFICLTAERTINCILTYRPLLLKDYSVKQLIFFAAGDKLEGSEDYKC